MAVIQHQEYQPEPGGAPPKTKPYSPQQLMWAHGIDETNDIWIKQRDNQFYYVNAILTHGDGWWQPSLGRAGHKAGHSSSQISCNSEEQSASLKRLSWFNHLYPPPATVIWHFKEGNKGWFHALRGRKSPLIQRKYSVNKHFFVLGREKG